MRRNKRFTTIPFPFLFLFALSSGINQKRCTDQSPWSSGKTKKRKNKRIEEEMANILFTALRNGNLLLKYVPPIESAASYAYIDLPARHGVNIHGGYRKNRHRASKLWTSERRKQTPRAFRFLVSPRVVIAISNALTTNSLLSSPLFCALRAHCSLFQ